MHEKKGNDSRSRGRGSNRVPPRVSTVRVGQRRNRGSISDTPVSTVFLENCHQNKVLREITEQKSPTFHCLRTFSNLLDSNLISRPATASRLCHLSLPVSLKEISCYRKQYPTAGAALTKCELLCSPEQGGEGDRKIPFIVLSLD